MFESISGHFNVAKPMALSKPLARAKALARDCETHWDRQSLCDTSAHTLSRGTHEARDELIQRPRHGH